LVHGWTTWTGHALACGIEPLDWPEFLAGELDELGEGHA
jgi:hypothetical protein